MVYLRRKIDEFLVKWKSNKERNPLIIKGARQVGKTESICHFANQFYKNVIYINFVEKPAYKTIINDGYSADDVIKNISLVNNEFNFERDNTVIIFDELQEFPQIATSLKFFKIDGRFDVIASGSLLGLNYKVIESNSVGYKEDYVMHSFDFEEFLWALGYTSEHYLELLENMRNITPLSEVQMQIFSKLFLDFCVLGGMPIIIRDYVANKTFENVLSKQRQLVLDYKEDIRKYANGLEQTKIINVFNQIPSQLAKENKKFQFSKIAKGARFKDYFGCIEWLQDAGIINLCFQLNFPNLPLRGNIDINKYKVYFADVGLLVAMLDDESSKDLRINKNLNIYKGALYENIIGEALHKQGYDLCYYKRENSTLEQDFFVRNSNYLIPIEVKSGNNKSKSLRELIKSDKYPDIKFGIKFINGNIGFCDDIYTFPYFCAFLLRRYLEDKGEN